MLCCSEAFLPPFNKTEQESSLEKKTKQAIRASSLLLQNWAAACGRTNDWALAHHVGVSVVNQGVL
jgi:hypothetical protein